MNPETGTSMNTAPNDPSRLTRREALQWVIAAGAAISLPSFPALAEEAAPVTGKPYGTDPVLNRTYKAGDLWPLTLAAGQRRTVTALSDLILPADDHSPAASAVEAGFASAALDPPALAAYAALVALVSPLWEESLFRGFLLPSLTAESAG